MSKRIIFIGPLLLFLCIHAFSQSDTTVCIDFNPDLNHQIRKNIIGINSFVGLAYAFPFELSYERILKKNTTIKLNGSGFPNIFFQCNIAYRTYFSNMKYGKTSYKKNTYLIRKKQTIMSAPKGLYVEAMGVFSMEDYYDPYSSYRGIRFFGIGVGLGYQFLLFTRLALNPSVQLPLTLEGHYFYSHDTFFYPLKPTLILNLNLGYAF
jgi:hypothetical protein